MGQKCQFCGGKVVYPEQRLCDKHLARYVEKRVDKVLGKILGREEKRFLVAVSGGKDSMGLAHAMAKTDLQMELLHLDLGVPEVSAPVRQVVEGFARDRELKLHTVSLADHGFTLPDLHDHRRDFRSTTCSLCGSVKRYLFNSFAHEHGFDFVATAHNLDDMAAFAVMGLSCGDLQYASRMDYVSWPEPEHRMVGRIRPYFYVPEKASLVYALTQGVPFSEAACPYVTGNKQVAIKGAVAGVEGVAPGFKLHLTKLVKGHKEPSQTSPNQCQLCGYPTAVEVCRFCRIKQKLTDQVEQA